MKAEHEILKEFGRVCSILSECELKYPKSEKTLIYRAYVQAFEFVLNSGKGSLTELDARHGYFIKENVK